MSKPAAEEIIGLSNATSAALYKMACIMGGEAMAPLVMEAVLAHMVGTFAGFAQESGAQTSEEMIRTISEGAAAAALDVLAANAQTSRHGAH